MLVRKKTLSAQLKKLEDHGYGHYNESDDKYNTYALDSLIEVMSVLHGTEPLSLLILNDEFIEDEAVELETFVSHLNLLALPTFEGADNFIQFFYDEQRSLKLQANPNYERRKVKQLIQKDVNSLPECEAYKGYEEACYRMYQENLRRILPDVYHYLSPF
jgi:hypothetical protein